MPRRCALGRLWYNAGKEPNSMAEPAGHFLKQTNLMYGGPYPSDQARSSDAWRSLGSPIAFVHRFPAKALMSPCKAVFWFSAAGPTVALLFCHLRRGFVGRPFVRRALAVLNVTWRHKKAPSCTHPSKNQPKPPSKYFFVHLALSHNSKA